jgi:Esterase/lipase
MKKITMAVCLTAISAFAQWGGGMGGGGFGGPQSGGNKMEYSEKFADVNYVGDGKTYHAMDIYLPKEAKDSYPVVIHTYGSAWSMNNSKGSADLNTICAALLKAGYAVVTPNHRSASDAIYPAQLHDLKAVVRYLRGNADKYKIDTSFIAMSGFSSGGHLSSLVATTCGLKEGKSGSVTVDLEGDLGSFTSFSSCIDAATLWSPPTDIYTMNPINNFMGSGTYEGAFIGAEREGNKDKWMVASSPYYASEDDAPTILFHGTADQIVNPEQSKELYDSLQKYKVKSELVSVPGGTHGGTEMYSSENLGKMTSFFDDARKAKAEKADSSSEETTRFIANKNVSHFDVKQDGNKLRVYGTETCRYKVYSVDGAYASRGLLQNQLDLSALSPGIYGIVVTLPSGEQKNLKFIRK